MKSNHIIGAFIAVAIVLGTSTAGMAKLPWPYGDKAMNELAMRTYAQQQAEKAGLGYYNPYGLYNNYNNYNNFSNPYPYGYGYGAPTVPSYYGAAPWGGWY